MNAAEIEIRPARPDDLPAAVALLNACQLPTDDLTVRNLATFFVAKANGQLVGVAGFEGIGADGLLRSLAVASVARGNGLGARLVTCCEDAAAAAGVQHLYLLTATADTYLQRLNYADVLRDAVPSTIAAHPQFCGLCPASAQCLRKTLA